MADCREGQGTAVLRLEGELNVRRSAELKGELAEALSHSNHLLLDLDEASGFDLSFLQLLCAAQHSAQHDKKRLSLGDVRPKALRELVAAAGFHPSDSCPETCRDSCLWSDASGVSQ